MTNKEAAQILDPETSAKVLREYGDGNAQIAACDEACRIAANVLRNKPALTDHFPDLTKMVPLTLEQLQEMAGQPVYCEDSKEWGIIHIYPNGPWANMPFFRGVYCDLDIQHNGMSLYAYTPAHIDLFTRVEAAEARAEKAERERDAAIKELDDVAAAVDDLSVFIDEQIYPLVQYDMYTALRENADAISMWQYESDWRGEKEE